MNTKTKTEFLGEFKSLSEAARELDVTRRTIYKWPEELNDAALRRIRDYFLHKKGKVPKKWMP